MVLMISVFALFSITWSELAPAQVHFGTRIGVYTDADDAFVGIEIVTPIVPKVFFNPNIEYIFVEHGNEITFNFDFHYDFSRGRNYSLWIGGGPGLFYINPEGPRNAHADFAVNLLFGAGFNVGKIIPYTQAKVVLSDHSDFVLALGLRF